MIDLAVSPHTQGLHSPVVMVMVYQKAAGMLVKLVLFVPFSIKHNSGEYDDGHGKGKEEKAQLRGTALECVAQNPQAPGVSENLKMRI